jgi:hypothetical protein
MLQDIALFAQQLVLFAYSVLPRLFAMFAQPAMVEIAAPVAQQAIISPDQFAEVALVSIFNANNVLHHQPVMSVSQDMLSQLVVLVKQHFTHNQLTLWFVVLAQLM